MRSTVVAAAILLGMGGTAVAEPWLSTLGAEVERATTIEIARVERIQGLTIEARLTEAIRSPRRAGDPVGWSRELLSMGSPAVGDEVVAICDATMCPRVLGVRAGDVFRLNAASVDLASVAWIAPEVVTAAGLRALAAGKAPPPACVRGTVQLLDEPAPASVDLLIDSATGRGRGRIGALDVAVDWTTRPSIENFGAGVFVRLGTEGRPLMLYTDRARFDGGCVGGDFWWGFPSPTPRTMAGLADAIAGRFTPHAVAVGTLVVDGGGALPAGRHAVRIDRGVDGELSLTSSLVSGPLTAEHSRSEISGGKPSLGVDVGKAGAVVMLFDQQEIDHVHHTSLMFVEDLAARHHVTLRLLWVPLPLPASGPPPFVDLGRARLDYVLEDGTIDPRPARPSAAPGPQAIAR